ncbi:MAG: peptide chain release factor N(5)-glutamine methyltransferase [Woeseia sp.]
MDDALTIGAVLAAGSSQLERVSDSARLEAELLLARAIDMPRSFLFAHPEDELDAAAIERFEASLGRRLAGEPMAYICGEKEFWSMMLMVTPATLVPRPETELLVEQALMRLPRRAECRLLDLGTGSGAIALALARERPMCEVTGTDISEAAIAVAIQNARQQLLPNVNFVHGDWTGPVQGQSFDLVVSNPPYIADSDDALKALGFEPRSALAAGADGLDAMRSIVDEVPQVIRPGGSLLLEHGAEQHAAVASLLAGHGYTEIAVATDLAGLHRVTSAKWPGW